MPTCASRGFALAVPCLFALLLEAAPARAQEATCADDFDVLVARVQENYAGYAIEVAGRRDAEYAAMVSRARAGARAAATTEGCIYALREYTSWFDDPHLFIGQFPGYDSTRTARLAAEVDRVDLGREQVDEYLRGPGARDPIEGIWYDPTTEIAVVADSAAGPGEFVGVVLASTAESWRPGEVKARISARARGAYRVSLRLDDRSPRYIEGSLYKGGLLFRLAPYAWGRLHPILPHQEGLLDRADPKAPALTTRSEDVIVLSVPSHDPRYRAALENLVRTAAPALERASLLVVDLRGNEGGSSGTTRILRPYYHSPLRAGVGTGEKEDRPVVLASPANLRAFERWKEWYDPDPEWLNTLLGELERRPGELVSFPASEETTTDAPPEAAEGPRRFAVLTDRGVVSAGEAFVLEVRRFARVTTYGQPTGGSIDYQNVQILSLADEEEGFVVGYPTLASSARLPEGGWNATGIPPDVRIAENVTDPIGVIIAAEARQLP